MQRENSADDRTPAGMGMPCAFYELPIVFTHAANMFAAQRHCAVQKCSATAAAQKKENAGVAYILLPAARRKSEQENNMQLRATAATAPDPRRAPPEIPVVPTPEPELPAEERPRPEIPQLPPDPAIAPSPQAPEIVPEHSPQEMPPPEPGQ